MKTNLLFVLSFFFSLPLFSQQNCSNPVHVTICPSVCLTQQTNALMGDDAPPACNIMGEDLVYEISVPNGAATLFVTLSNVTAPMLLSLEPDTCGVGACNSRVALAGNSNLTFNVSATRYYYLWVDAGTTVTYDICFGADTGSTYVVIPDTQGNLQFDTQGCGSPLFSAAKPYFQLSYNGIFQTNPMTLAPLSVPGTLCLTTFLKNTTGIEAVKKFTFTFNPGGFTVISAALPTVSGFYNAGNWVATNVGNIWTFLFHDAASTGKGDFAPPQDSCLAYSFCFNVTPISNNATLTNIDVGITSDGFGAGSAGWVHNGCCPASFSGCIGSGSSSTTNTHSFGYSVNDPGSSLPITLIAFDAKRQIDKVLVTWETATEINNGFFSVERGVSENDWAEIGRVNGAGNSTVQRVYQYRDEFPLTGISYYRLKQTDYDGQFTYLGIREIKILDADDIFVFPNPAKTELKILSSENKIAAMQLTLFNVMGEMILTPFLTNPGGILLDVTALPRGFYLLVIEENGSVVKREKIILQK